MPKREQKLVLNAHLIRAPDLELDLPTLAVTVQHLLLSGYPRLRKKQAR